MCPQTLCVWLKSPSAPENISIAHWLFPQMGRERKDRINGMVSVKTYQESTGNIIELLLCFTGPMSCRHSLLCALSQQKCSCCVAVCISHTRRHSVSPPGTESRSQPWEIWVWEICLLNHFYPKKSVQVNPGTVAADVGLSHSARERLSVGPATCGTQQVSCPLQGPSRLRVVRR